MEREENRIRYDEMLVKGLVRIVRRRYGGGYFTILTPPEGVSGTKRVAFRSQYVHLAVGYPGLKFLPELQRYRTEHNDYHHIVNAYEAHEHVYERLMQQPEHRAGAGRRHRRVAGAAAADGRPAQARAPRPTSSTCSAPTTTAPTTATATSQPAGQT